VRIDEQIRRCTSFLSIRKEQRDGWAFYPVGTAFYVGELLGNDRAIKYVVTARHLVDGSRPFGSLWVRCVATTGEKRLFELPTDSWWQHPTTDVAIAPLTIPLEKYELQFLPLHLIADAAWLQEHDVGLGDQIVACGLFSQYIGQERDAPIVRFGRIALIPNELIRIPGQGAMPAMEFSAILAELGSWAGQSGSPVFVYFRLDRNLFTGDTIQMKMPNPRLLGLIHGHYTLPQNVIDLSGEVSKARVQLNSGIAIVIPATAILDVLEQERAVTLRAEYVRILREDGLIQ
jgi:hypothetical protein